MRIILIIILLSGLQQARAQETVEQASLSHWALHAATGLQSSAYLEAGISKVYYEDKKFGASLLWFAAVECSPNLHAAGQTPVWGIKAGAAGFSSIFGIGADLKYLTDFSSSTLMLTPKAGIGLLGAVNLFIGYNIMDTYNPFRTIGPWQLSLDINYSKQLWKQLELGS